MESYTAGSEEGIQAVIDANLLRSAREGPYHMALSTSDFSSFVKVLQYASGFHGEVSEWAADFLSSVATTLGVEFI